MLDRDIAELYGVKTKALNQAVKRNLGRFPLDFMFQLQMQEALKLQIVSERISQITFKHGQNVKYLPFVFTEQGVAMLSSVLRSPQAIQVNIAIIRAFVKLRHAVLSNQDISRRVEKLEGKINVHETDIRLILDDVQCLKKRPTFPTDPINPSIL